jgi:hypothetical protein
MEIAMSKLHEQAPAEIRSRMKARCPEMHHNEFFFRRDGYIMSSAACKQAKMTLERPTMSRIAAI